MTITATEGCRRTLSDAVVSGAISIDGDAQLWLVGSSSVETSGKAAVSCTETLTFGGNARNHRRIR